MPSYDPELGPSFTRGEYWLLESVVDLAMPIRWLTLSKLDEAMNKTPHEMDRSALVRTLDGLFKAGLIEAYRHADATNRTTVISVEELEACFGKPRPKTSEDWDNQWYYCLTARGGMYWEAFAKPEWDRYVYHSVSAMAEDDVGDGEIICANQHCGRTYFDHLHYFGVEVVASSLIEDELSPWQATYWKQLPLGHRLRFRCHERRESVNWNNIPLSAMTLHENREWYSWK